MAFRATDLKPELSTDPVFREVGTKSSVVELPASEFPLEWVAPYRPVTGIAGISGIKIGVYGARVERTETETQTASHIAFYEV